MSIDYDRYRHNTLRVDLKNSIKTDLREYRPNTVFRELFQNADDAGATRVVVHLSGPDPGLPECVTVANDACFVVNSERDDLERFQVFRARGKESEDGEIIGLFGIGRVACYHLCDLPTVVTHANREQWMALPLDLDQQEGFQPIGAVTQIPGFPARSEVLPTTYWLPIRASKTRLSRELGVEPITPKSWSEIQATLETDHLCELMLFLNHVRLVEVYRNDEPLMRLEKRVREGPDGELPDKVMTQICTFETAGTEPTEYLVFESNAPPDEAGAADGRTWRRKVAFRWSSQAPAPVDGKLFCYLPTSIRTGFPFHVHASFHVNMNRARLDESSRPWNEQILSLQGELFLSVMPYLRDLCERNGNPLELYRLFPLEAAPGGPEELESLIQAAWDPTRLQDEPVLLDHSLHFQPVDQILLPVSRRLHHLFSQTDQPLVCLELLDDPWLSCFQKRIGQLQPLDADSAIRWLSTRIAHGQPLTELAPPAAQVLSDKDRYVELLLSLQELGCQPQALNGLPLALTADGRFWNLVASDTVWANDEIRAMLEVWEQELGEKSNQDAPPSAYLIDALVQSRAGGWLKPVLGEADLDFVLSQMRQLVAEKPPELTLSVFTRLGKDPVEGCLRWLKFLGKLDPDITVERLEGLYLLDRSAQPLPAEQAVKSQARALEFFFTDGAVRLLHHKLNLVKDIPVWRASHLHRVDPAHFPALGAQPDSSLEPPFQTARQLAAFLGHLDEVWEEGCESLAELCLFLDERGRFRPVTVEQEKLLLPPEIAHGNKDLARLQKLFPSPTIVHPELQAGQARKLLERLHVKTLDLWQYLCATVVPALSRERPDDENLVELVEILRRIDVTERWNQHESRRAELSGLPFLLSSARTLAAPSELFEPTPDVLALLGAEAPLLHKVYQQAKSIAILNDRMQFLRSIGLRSKLEPDDLISFARRIQASGEVTRRSCDEAGRLLRHLDSLELTESLLNELAPLAEIAWMPADRSACAGLEPGRLHPPRALYSPILRPLIWTQLPCGSDYKVSPTAYQLAGLRDQPPPWSQVLAHMSELKKLHLANPKESHLEDYRKCLAHLDDHYPKEDPQGLKTGALFPDRNGSSFHHVDDLLPQSCEKHFGDLWDHYIDQSTPGYKLARKLGMPSQPTARHYVEFIRRLASRHPADLSEELERRYREALVALARSEEEDLSRMHRMDSIYCQDHRFRKPAQVWVDDRADLRNRLQECNPSTGTVKDNPDLSPLYRQLEIPRLSHSHGLTVRSYRPAPEAPGPRVEAWLSPAKKQAYRRCWYHCAETTGRSRAEEPPVASMSIMMASSIEVADRFFRGETLVGESPPRRAESAIKEGPLMLLQAQLKTERTRLAFVSALASFLADFLKGETTTQLGFMLEPLLDKDDNELSSYLDERKVIALPSQLEGDREAPAEEDEANPTPAATGPGGDDSGSEGDSSPLEASPNRRAGSPVSLQPEPDEVEEEVVQVRAHTRNYPASKATRAEKIVWWDWVRGWANDGEIEVDPDRPVIRRIGGKKGKKRRGSSARVVFVSSHWRSLPGDSVSDDELDQLWDSWVDEEPPFSPTEVYLNQLHQHLSKLGYLSPERAQHYRWLACSEGGLTPDQLVAQLANCPATSLDSYHEDLLSFLILHHGIGGVEASRGWLLEEPQQHLVMKSLGRLVDWNVPVDPSHWAVLLHGHRARFLGLAPRSLQIRLLRQCDSLEAWLLGELTRLDLEAAGLLLQECCHRVRNQHMSSYFLEAVMDKVYGDYDLPDLIGSRAGLSMLAGLTHLPAASGFRAELREWLEVFEEELDGTLEPLHLAGLCWFAGIFSRRKIPCDGLLAGIRRNASPDGFVEMLEGARERLFPFLPRELDSLKEREVHALVFPDQGPTRFTSRFVK